MENADRWSILCARMNRLGSLLDELTVKAMNLLKAPDPESATLQMEMCSLRLQARQLVKTIKANVQEMKQGA